MKIIKKDGTLEDYNEQKIIDAVDKAARRDNYNFTEQDYQLICNTVLDEIDEEELDDECEEPKVDDTDEQIEELIDTDEETKPRDSKKSFGAIERKKKTKDSIEDAIDVETAWAKRYGGK